MEEILTLAVSRPLQAISNLIALGTAIYLIGRATSYMRRRSSLIHQRSILPWKNAFKQYTRINYVTASRDVHFFLAHAFSRMLLIFTSAIAVFAGISSLISQSISGHRQTLTDLVEGLVRGEWSAAGELINRSALLFIALVLVLTMYRLMKLLLRVRRYRRRRFLLARRIPWIN
jgi:hypothetical protein